MPQAEPERPETPGIPQLTEHLFRHESGKLVSILTGIFGIDRLQLAEDVVQEALIRALQSWPYYGIPQNPSAWLLQTAKHLALDVVRREKLFHEKQPDIIASMDRWPTGEGEDSPVFDDEIKDGRLRLMFACCHPLIPSEAQAALALKTLCGFSPREIATVYLTSEAAIAKRLTRARQKIRELQIPFEIPSGLELAARLAGVQHILYLLFNEGYKASSGDNLVREDLCHEAIRLALLLVEHPSVNHPTTHALLALMLMNAARLKTRVDAEGNILRLMEQDRSQWDRGLIMRALQHISLSTYGNELSEYHIQAGIAACHCMAPTYEATDWSAILAHYNRWTAINDSPIIALNRAVALAQVRGAEVGLEAARQIPDRKRLEDYYLYHAVLGEFEAQRGQRKEAADCFQRALELAEMPTERSFLARRLRECAA